MGHAPAKTSRKPRADSLRNRDLLLAAAREVFSVGGPEASLEAVARRAGVGIGTLYRHFPTREALFQGVYRHEVDELVALAARLVDDPAPAEALRRWLQANVGMVATKKGMLEALAPTLDGADAVYAESAARLAASADRLMARAVAAGEIRGDVTPEDLMRAVVGMCYVRRQPGWQDAVGRLVDVFVDGMRTPGSRAD
jgi:AcrR family transcriptional regulator